MPVDTKHPEYLAAVARWKRARDVTSGEDAVKAAGEAYLPRIGAQTQIEYDAYKLRASLFNATGRTHDGLVGLVFRKDPESKLPTGLDVLADDIDLSGTRLDEFARKVLSDELLTARGGILAEYPKAEVRERTADEIDAEGLRPYLTYWPAESIIDWRVGRVGAKSKLTFLKLYAVTYEPDLSDRWDRVRVEWIRVYRLDASGVSCEVYSKADKAGNGHPTEWPIIANTFPIVVAGAPAAEIPFVFITQAVPSKAALDDLVLTNLSHYRTSADYENSAHWSGTPTPVFIGSIMGADGGAVTEVRLGSSSGINLSENGDAKMLQAEMEDGLGAVLDRKENYMAILGARILSGEKRQVEAAETAAIHRAGENSVLATAANSVSRALSKALEYAAAFAGISGEISYRLSTDYLPTPMDAQTLTAVVSAWQNGAMSGSELFEALISGEVIRAGKDPAEHAAELEAEAAERERKAQDMLAAAANSRAAPNDGVDE